MAASDVFTELAQSWPSPWVSRGMVDKFSGGLIHPRTIANADARGEGPGTKIKIGRKVAYRKADLVDWLRSRAEG